MKRSGRGTASGITLTIVLLVITLLVIIVALVVRQGLGSLHQAKLVTASQQALFAAEAGAADAFRRLVEDPAWSGPLPETAMPGGAIYSAEVVNNLSGTTPQTASNGALVRPGLAYVLASGRSGPQGVSRRAGVLLRPGTVSAFTAVIGVGSNVSMQGGKTIGGSVKANGAISLQGSTRIVPINNSGRLLSSGNVSTQGSTTMDEAQDVRARGSVSASPAIRGAYLVQSGDTSDSTLPFLLNYQTDNILNPGDSGFLLPNPDQTAMAAQWTEHDATCIGSTFDTGSPCLNGHPATPSQLHHFPAGLTLGGSTTITGGGTLVVTGGNPLVFGGSSSVEANLVVLRSVAQQPSAGDPSIRFQGSSSVKGLVYAHQDIHFQGSSQVEGLVIAYFGSFSTQGSSDIRLDASVLEGIPGFEAWVSGFGGSGGIPAGSSALSILSWERQ